LGFTLIDNGIAVNDEISLIYYIWSIATQYTKLPRNIKYTLKTSTHTYIYIHTICHQQIWKTS